MNMNRDICCDRRFQAVRAVTPTSDIWSLVIREVREGDGYSIITPEVVLL